MVETLAKLYLVIEYAGGGELFAKITNEGRFKETDAMPLFAQAMSAMDHLVITSTSSSTITFFFDSLFLPDFITT